MLDEVAVQAGGEPDGVLVPVQDVERGRLLAEQVVVDDVVPDEVVRPQPREHARERLAVEVAAARRFGDGGRRELAVRERRGRAGALVVERGDQQAEAGELAEPALGGEVAEHAGADDAAGAGAVEVDDAAPVMRRDGVARLEDGGGVGVEVEVPLLDVRVAPRDREDLLSLLDEPLDHAAAGREVEHVVLVDRRRGEQQRHLAHLLGLRRVLDELEDLGAQHDRARRDREVLADRELARVDGRRQAREVAQEVARASDEVPAALVDGLP